MRTSARRTRRRATRSAAGEIRAAVVLDEASDASNLLVGRARIACSTARPDRRAVGRGQVDALEEDVHGVADLRRRQAALPGRHEPASSRAAPRSARRRSGTSSARRGRARCTRACARGSPAAQATARARELGRVRGDRERTPCHREERELWILLRPRPSSRPGLLAVEAVEAQDEPLRRARSPRAFGRARRAPSRRASRAPSRSGSTRRRPGPGRSSRDDQPVDRARHRDVVEARRSASAAWSSTSLTSS